jgi:hypothetical protein
MLKVTFEAAADDDLPLFKGTRDGAPLFSVLRSRSGTIGC